MILEKAGSLLFYFAQIYAEIIFSFVDSNERVSE